MNIREERGRESNSESEDFEDDDGSPQMPYNTNVSSRKIKIKTKYVEDFFGIS